MFIPPDTFRWAGGFLLTVTTNPQRNWWVAEGLAGGMAGWTPLRWRCSSAPPFQLWLRAINALK